VQIDRRLISHFDWPLLFFSLLFVAVGVTTIYSANYDMAAGHAGPLPMRQVTWLGLGLIAMFTALASLFTNKPVRPDVAMTGEITLRGLVLPIGGLKEKSLAAMRAGISTVIIPKLNEKDLVDVPEEAKQKLKFVPVENVDEVLAVALEKDGAAIVVGSMIGLIGSL